MRLTLQRVTAITMLVIWACALTVQGQSRDVKLQFLEPSPEKGQSLAVVVDDVPLAHTVQLLPLDSSGQLIGRADCALQTRQIISNLTAVLRTARSGLGEVVKLNIYLAKDTDRGTIQKTLSTVFGKSPPAVSFVVSDLPVPGVLVALDAVAVSTPAPSGEASPIGRFSSAQVYQDKGVQHAAVLPPGPKVYVSGMADTNGLLMATRKTLEKLVGTLGHLGLGKADVVQLKAFLQPMSSVAGVRDEIVSFFGGSCPPLIFVEWISPNPPIEIELIAAGKAADKKEADSVTFLTPPGTVSSKVYSRVARVNHGRLIYTSGLYGTNSRDAAAEVREIFGSLDGIARKTASDFEHLVKATYYVSTEGASAKLNELRPEFYNPQRPPAASKAKVRHAGLAEKTVMLDMIAVTK